MAATRTIGTHRPQGEPLLPPKLGKVQGRYAEWPAPIAPRNFCREGAQPPRAEQDRRATPGVLLREHGRALSRYREPLADQQWRQVRALGCLALNAAARPDRPRQDVPRRRS